eukprot:COSAG05_NODE_1481_length_4761_cov_4.755684_3_plen_35_part_00
MQQVLVPAYTNAGKLLNYVVTSNAVMQRTPALSA